MQYTYRATVAFYECGIELTYSLGLDRRYDVSSLNEDIRKGGVTYLQNIIRKMHVGGGTLLSGVSYAGWGYHKIDDMSISFCQKFWFD